MNRRVLITGIGLVTPIGIGVDENWGSLVNGKGGIDYITSFNVENSPVKMAGEIKDLSVEKYVNAKKTTRLMSRESKLAVSAGKLALFDSGIDISDIDPRKVGLYLGVGPSLLEVNDIIRTTLASLDEEGMFSIRRYGSNGLENTNPMLGIKMLTNMPLAHVAINLNIKGPNCAYSPFSPQSAQAIGEGFRSIKDGIIDIAFTGGTESMANPFDVALMHLFGLLSQNGGTKAYKVFDKERDGIVLGEGAGILVLEEAEHAKSRGAKIYGELLGFGYSTDVKEPLRYSRDAQGYYIAMKNALDSTGLDYNEVGYINAEGNGTILSDKNETMAIKMLFGENAYSIPVSSTKTFTGHMMSASTPFGIISSLLAIKKGILPPTLHYKSADNDCDLDYIPNTPRRRDVNIAISNSFGLYGTNFSFVIGRHKER